MLSRSKTPKGRGVARTSRSSVASSKAEKSTARMLAGAPTDSESLQQAPKLLLTLDHSSAPAQWALDLMSVHKDHQQTKGRLPPNSGNWLYLGWHLEMKSPQYQPQEVLDPWNKGLAIRGQQFLPPDTNDGSVFRNPAQEFQLGSSHRGAVVHEYD